MRLKKNKSTPQHTEGVIAGSIDKPFWTKLPQKRYLILSAVLVLGAVVGYVLYRRQSNRVDFTERVLQNIQQDNKVVDYSASGTNLDKAIADAKKDGDTTLLLELYAHRAALAASNRDYKTAIDNLLARQQLDPSTAEKDAYALAQAYEGDKQIEKAIETYKVALKYYENLKYDSQFEATGGDTYYINTIKQKLRKLGAQS